MPGLPAGNDDDDAYCAEMVERVIRGVERGQIPAAQYQAVLIDEGHDFEPEWLKLVVQMVDPSTNSLLVLYDDAQIIYGAAAARSSASRASASRRRAAPPSSRSTTATPTKSCASPATWRRHPQGAATPTTTACRCHAAIRRPRRPRAAGGQAADAARRSRVHRPAPEGRPSQRHAWRDMAVIYRHYNPVGKAVLATLRGFGVPATYFKDATFAPDEDAVTCRHHALLQGPGISAGRRGGRGTVRHGGGAHARGSEAGFMWR